MAKKAKNSKCKTWHKIVLISQDRATAGMGQEGCLPYGPSSIGGSRKKRLGASGEPLRTKSKKPGAAAEDRRQREEGGEAHVVPVKSSHSSWSPKHTHAQGDEGEEMHYLKVQTSCKLSWG